ncbi:MAG: long-chain fatty acid transporter [Acidobacteria bacterium]|nr:MAG: long-chain fatty acid transporter [Acidobacteriota bacterium]
MAKRIRFWLLLAVVTGFAAQALATDGYLSSGYGVKQLGRGGTGVALPEDSLAAATNPAGMVFVGDRFDIGASYFRPVRSGSINGNQLPPGYPNIGSNMSLGISMYGNGGMNTSYFKAIPLLGTSGPGVDLQQMFIAPTFAVKVNRHNAVGVSLNIGYEMFKAYGLENFASSAFSIDPAHVTNRGYDATEGLGVRVGWLGEVRKNLSLGATYQSRTYMGKLSLYRGLFAEQGAFDIPANFSAGFAFSGLRKTTIAFDVERILYSDVKAIANLGSNQALLGSNNGPGFGWHDITAPKVGVEYQVNSKLTLRGGYNHSGVPFSNTQTFFNLLAPGIVQSHATTGATWSLGNGKELSFAYFHAFQKTISGVNSIPPSAGGGNANLRMSEDSIGISFGWLRE